MIEQSKIYELSNQPPTLSIVIRCGRDRKGLTRCLESIDQSTEVIVSAADDADFLEEVRHDGYLLAPHQYGNWSLAAENGLKATTHNDVIIMDSDATFAPQAINYISDALKKGNLLVQPQVVFLTDKNVFSRLTSNARTHENRYAPKAYSPGLGIKKQEILNTIGVDGNIYNPQVLYGDDGYIDQMAKSKGVRIFVAEKAIIYHDPISLKHELLTVLRFGRGQRQLEAEPSGVLTQLAEEFFSPEAKIYFREAYKRYDEFTALYLILCRLTFLLGYHMENIKKK